MDLKAWSGSLGSPSRPDWVRERGGRPSSSGSTTSSCWARRPRERRQNRGCIVRPPFRARHCVAGIVESGYGLAVVDQTSKGYATRFSFLQKDRARMEGGEPMVGEVKYLEWSPAGGPPRFDNCSPLSDQSLDPHEHVRRLAEGDDRPFRDHYWPTEASAERRIGRGFHTRCAGV